MKNRDASDESSRGGLAPEHVAPAHSLTSCGDSSLFYSPGGQKDVTKAFSKSLLVTKMSQKPSPDV